MSKVVHKKGTIALSVASNQVVDTLDITNCNGVSVQLNGITGTAGSMQLQMSNDNSNWFNLGSALTLQSGALPNVINQSAVYTGHVRVLVTLSGGAGNYDYFMLAKER